MIFPSIRALARAYTPIPIRAKWYVPTCFVVVAIFSSLSFFDYFLFVGLFVEFKELLFRCTQHQIMSKFVHKHIHTCRVNCICRKDEKCQLKIVKKPQHEKMCKEWHFLSLFYCVYRSMPHMHTCVDSIRTVSIIRNVTCASARAQDPLFNLSANIRLYAVMCLDLCGICSVHTFNSIFGFFFFVFFSPFHGYMCIHLDVMHTTKTLDDIAKISFAHTKCTSTLHLYTRARHNIYYLFIQSTKAKIL